VDLRQAVTGLVVVGLLLEAGKLRAQCTELVIDLGALGVLASAPLAQRAPAHMHPRQLFYAALGERAPVDTGIAAGVLERLVHEALQHFALALDPVAPRDLARLPGPA
jgi:hypothetical protein